MTNYLAVRVIDNIISTALILDSKVVSELDVEWNGVSHRIKELGDWVTLNHVDYILLMTSEDNYYREDDCVLDFFVDIKMINVESFYRGLSRKPCTIENMTSFNVSDIFPIDGEYKMPEWSTTNPASILGLNFCHIQKLLGRERAINSVLAREAYKSNKVTLKALEAVIE